MSDLQKFITKICPKDVNIKQIDEKTKNFWYLIRPIDVNNIINKLNENIPIILEVIQKGKGVIFAGQGKITGKTFTGNYKVHITGFKNSSTNPLVFKNKNQFDGCKGECNLILSKKQVFEQDNNVVQVFKIKNTQEDISGLIYLRCQNDSAERKIIRQKANILRNSRFN